MSSIPAARRRFRIAIITWAFNRIEQLERYPATCPSPLRRRLTLQGAIAHCDMPIESGPTQLLPYSQLYLPGYLAALLEDFRDYFEAAFRATAAGKGRHDLFQSRVVSRGGDQPDDRTSRASPICFRSAPAMAARSRSSTARASANACSPCSRKWRRRGGSTAREVEDVIAATGEGYPFPTDLDVDSPLSGLAPASQQDIMREALKQRLGRGAVFRRHRRYEAVRHSA